MSADELAGVNEVLWGGEVAVVLVGGKREARGLFCAGTETKGERHGEGEEETVEDPPRIYRVSPSIQSFFLVPS